MSEPTFDQKEGGFTFTDEDFERRYCSPEENIQAASGSDASAGRVKPQGMPGAARPGSSRNRFMRTLLRRRLAWSARP